MYSKIAKGTDGVEPLVRESLADMLFEIGHHQCQQGSYDGALFWLERAYDELSVVDIGLMSSDAGDLKLSVMHDLVRTLMHQAENESQIRSWNMIGDMETQFRGNLVVSLLKLDYLGSLAEPPAEDYSSVLHGIAQSVQLSDANIKTLLHHVHNLRYWDPSQAHSILSSFIYTRLLNVEEPDWLEKTLITAVWNAITSGVIENPIEILTTLFDEIIAGTPKSLRPDAIHAIQVLIWKAIEDCMGHSKHEEAGNWCLLALHKVLLDSGARNVGRIQRKLMQCCLAQRDVSRAHEAFSRMSEQVQNEPSSQFLLYKIALQRQDSALAQHSLQSINRLSKGRDTFLYACVLEAQKVGDQAQSIITLQELLKRPGVGRCDGSSLPAILRCTARMLIQQLDNDDHPTTAIQDICQLFEMAVSHAKRSQRDSSTSPFTTAELDWFSRNTYNLALKFLAVWPCQHTARMVDACSNFLELYPSQTQPAESPGHEDLELRRLFCHFLAASLYITMARQEDALEVQLQYYLSVRHAAEKHRNVASHLLECLSGELKHDLHHKYATLCIYDFEAAARLRTWDSLEYLIQVSFL